MPKKPSAKGDSKRKRYPAIKPALHTASKAEVDSYVSRKLSSEDIQKIEEVLSIGRGSLESLPEPIKAKLSADELRQLLGIKHTKEDALPLEEAVKFYKLWIKLTQSQNTMEVAGLMNFGILYGDKVTIPLMIEKEINLKNGDAASEQRIEELQVCAGKWLMGSIRNNDSRTFSLLANILELRAKGKEPNTLKHTDLGIPTTKGRQRTHNELKNIAFVTAMHIASKYSLRQLRVPRREFEDQFNNFAQGAGLDKYKVKQTALSMWIKRTGLQPFMRKETPGPKKRSCDA